jgi:FecR protein/Glucodextranase, domain B
MAQDKDRRPKNDDDLLDWFTVSYRSLYLAVIVVVGLLGGGYYMLFRRVPPSTTTEPAHGTDDTSMARFTVFDGTVKVKTVGSFEWLTASTRMSLRKGDLVRTGSGATAALEFFDGTVVQMRPDSLLTIEESGEDPRTKQRRVALGVSSGDVSYNKPASSGSTQVSTPTVRVMQAAGVGAGGLRVDQSGETDVRVFAGNSATVESHGGGTLTLQPNEGVRIDSSGKAGQKLTLPPGPVLLAPPHQAEIAYPDTSQGTTLLVWREVPNATQYRVMVADTASFTRPFVDQRVKEVQVPVRGLDVGKYYWRVAAVGPDGLEGSFSDFSRFAVVRAAANLGAPPPLQVDSLDLRANILQIKGRCEPGATVTVNGQRIEVQSDGSFNEFVTLDKAGQQIVTVRGVGLNGGVAERRQSVVVAPF